MSNDNKKLKTEEPFFSPRDFSNYTYYQNAVDAAKAANAKLEAALSPVVYGSINESDTTVAAAFGTKKLLPDTHSARLFNIQKIAKEPCAHAPEFIRYTAEGILPVTCKHCGIELRQRWEPAYE